MLRLRSALALAALLAPAPILAQQAGRGQSDPALWRFVYPNAKALIGIDWGRIRQSPAGAMIREKWIPRDGMAGFPIFELLDSIDRFLISSPGRNSSSDKNSLDDSSADAPADSPGNPGDSPTLIAIQGRFEAGQVRQLFKQFGAKVQSYNSFQVYRPQAKSNKDMAYVLFDAATILYGDAPSVFAALDRNQFAPASSAPSPAPGSMAGRAAELEAKYEIWAIMDTAEIMSSDPIADLLGANAWASTAQGFEAGLNLHSGLDADLVVRFSSEDTAKRVTAELTRAVAAAAKDKSVDTQAQGIAKKLKFNVDGSATKVSLRLSEQELEKTAEAFAAGEKASERLAARTPPNRDPAPPPSPGAPPSKPAVIRIEGLDEGTREIPYPHPEN
jgi:hypothetical protein